MCCTHHDLTAHHTYQAPTSCSIRHHAHRGLPQRLVAFGWVPGQLYTTQPAVYDERNLHSISTAAQALDHCLSQQIAQARWEGPLGTVMALFQLLQDYQHITRRHQQAAVLSQMLGCLLLHGVQSSLLLLGVAGV